MPSRPRSTPIPPRPSSTETTEPARRRQLGADRRSGPIAATTVTEGRIAVGRLAIVVTVGAWCAYFVSWLVGELDAPGGTSTRSEVEAAVYLLVVTFLTLSALAYLACRLGYLYRTKSHRRVPRAALDEFFSHTDPTLTVLVPSYKEDRRVIRTTLLSAALQEYPHLRIVLLIDDPPDPLAEADQAALAAARALPGQVQELLAEPAGRFAAALDAFEGRPRQEERHREDLLGLATDYEWAVQWLEEQSAAEEILDHADRFFVNEVLGGLAADFTLTATALRAAAEDGAILGPERLRQLHRRLVWTFRAELSSFERKRYASSSHDANKAMNLNSYIGLMGGAYQDLETLQGRVLVPTPSGTADLVVPDPDFVATLDADSILMPEYCLRMVHLLEQSEHSRAAVAQTPYSSYPGAETRIERLAGATTDLQYQQHQGLCHYDATFWVGANAVLRKRALDEICESHYEGNWEIRRYIQDRTVIEDTESTLDLARHGWKLVNFPERLAYSATPPDFGALCIQRRRWANGGLLILGKLRRYRKERKKLGLSVPVSETLLRTNYLASITWASLSLVLLLGYPFRNELVTPLLGLIALPYFAAMASDLRSCGYKWTDVARIYGFNLILLPINLAGVFDSVVQWLTGDKSVFGRTPKVRDRTVPSLVFVVMPWLILGLAGFTLWRDVVGDRVVNGVYAGLNTVLLAYALVAFIGLGNTVRDLWAHLRSWLYRPAQAPLAGPTTAASVIASPPAVDWASVLHFGGSPAPGLFGAAPAAPAAATSVRDPDPDRPGRSRQSGFRTVFQPVVDLRSGAVVGYEVLTRFDDGIGPADRLAQAASVGAGIELELLLARAGVAAAASLPGSSWISINVSPGLLRAGLALSHALSGASRPVVLELDHRRIASEEELVELVGTLPVGTTLALSGIVPAYDTLHLLEEHGPEIGKLDAGWVRGLPGDPARQALVRALVDVAERTGCNLVAEGIETRAEHESLLELGVPLGQGFLLGRPTSSPAGRDHTPLPSPTAG